MPGYKYNMMDLQAAIGLHQLASLEARLRRREAIWRLYDEALASFPVTRPAPVPQADRHARHLYTVLVDPDSGWTRDALGAALQREGISTSVHFKALHLQPYYAERFRLRRGMFPVAELVSERTLSLPLSSAMTDEQVNRVVYGAPHVVADTMSGRPAAGVQRHLRGGRGAAHRLRTPGSLPFAGARARGCAGRGGARHRRRRAGVLQPPAGDSPPSGNDDDLRRLDPEVVVVDDPSIAAVRRWVRRARRLGVPVGHHSRPCDRGDRFGSGRSTEACSHRERIDGRFGSLRGPLYAILDPRVRAARERLTRPLPRRVLIALGGGPRAAMAARLARAIAARAGDVEICVAGGFMRKGRMPALSGGHVDPRAGGSRHGDVVGVGRGSCRRRHAV